MSRASTREHGSETQSATSLEDLKTFRPAGKGPWGHVTDTDWEDWRWQMKNRITTVAQLQQLLPNLTSEEFEGTLLSDTKLSMAITPHFFNLIDRSDINCPIRKQVVPRIEETVTAPWEMTDPCGEDDHSPVPGLVHRYPDRVLFLVTDRCAAYCRYCTRSRLVSNATGYDFHPNFEKQIDYIRRTESVRDVLLSGGDPLLLSDDKIGFLLGELRKIPHVEFLRIGTRIPIFLPQRITTELCEILKRFHPLFVSIHSNHPREITDDVRIALGRLADAGIPLGNQSVLLKGVNDEPTVMRALVHKLLMSRVKPYYLYQCDLISGSSHLRTHVARGLELIESMRGHTTGYAIPQYVIDAPGGGGKVPMNPNYLRRLGGGTVQIRNFENRTFDYPDASAEESGASDLEPTPEMDHHHYASGPIADR